mmetsp:Transcript_10619/g.13827  ORF Transcript_10619/g.13827 Transcript_10619/m.13827 type:complete len:226 (-) Transcript_10619:626-1303(-)|eukprot:CAMPEP_0116061758 /NCGR_PEP_ID=MMETSP0322-20121206/7279_1 /TAXON_ID=163516 /ORGANISM="Leptocylindrus danicus var. apora, Strain B651" /LENGTH=225 /DNA_ID=CAMNT_0003546785 /DNA_START=79 /DNA_END=756 /DNA_ORIENTATION=+
MSNHSLGDFGLSPAELEEQMRIMRSIEQRRNVTGSSNYSAAANMNHSHTSSHNNTNTHNNTNNNNYHSNSGVDGTTGRNYTRRNTPNEMSSGNHHTNRAAQEEVQEDPITENEAPGPKLTSCPVNYSPDWEWISKVTKPLIWNNVGLNEGVSRSSRTKASSSNSSGGYRLKEGGIVRGVKSGSEDENKRPVRCLGCNVMLWVDKDANLVSCPDCWSVSPVVTSSN